MLTPRAPVHGKATLKDDVLTIETIRKRGTATTNYRLIRLEPNPAVAAPAFRLLKDDGTFHDVRLERTGPECDCEDYNWCRRNRPEGCKHIRALQAVGMLVKE